MTAITTGDFNGMACLWLDNELIRLAVTTDRGPRIVFWGWRDGENIFAELPDAVIETPNGGYHLLGGHRLCHAPEVLSRTYWPDDDPVTVAEMDNGASFTPPPDASGIVKQMAVEVTPDRPEVKVTHTLTNVGSWTVQLAPWALSMCRLGGVAILPQPREPVDPHALLPNRSFTFWPYSNLSDERLYLGNQVALVKAAAGPNNKVGYRSVHGWFAYWIDGTLFSTRFDPQLGSQHPDLGCNAEFFFGRDAIEVESLGPLVQLEPNGQVTHVERWRLHSAPSPVTSEADALMLAATLDL